MPRNMRGKTIHITTLIRWALHGVRGVRLKTVKVGRRRCTTRAWLLEFFEQLALVDRPAPPIMQPAQMRRQAEIAARRAREILGLPSATTSKGD